MVSDAGKVKPLFPRYFFAEIIDRWWELKTIPGVSRVLVNGTGIPVSIAVEVLETLRRRERNGVIVLPKRDRWIRGSALKTRDPWHVLAGRPLLFQGMRGKDRARVLIQWFGQSQYVDIPANLLVSA